MRIIATAAIAAALALLGQAGGQAAPDTYDGCAAELRRATAGHPRAAGNPCDGISRAEYARVLEQVRRGG